MQYIVVVALLVIPFVACTELRGEKNLGLPQHIREKLALSHPRLKVGTKNINGAYPSNPVYGSIAEYTSGTCAGTPEVVKSYLANACFSDGSVSEMFACSTTSGVITATKTSYTSADCTTGGTVVATLTSDSCENGSKVTACSSNPTDFALGGPLVIQNNYQSSTCASSTIESATGYINNFCYDIGGASIKFNWPNLSEWDTNGDCSGSASVTYNLQTAANCVIVTTDSGDDQIRFDSYEQYSYISGANSNAIMSFGVLASLLMAMMHLWKN